MTKNKKIVGSIIGAIVLTITGIVGIQEKPNNSGFKDPVFEQEMKKVGWHTGDAWCVYTCIYTYHKVLKDKWPKADSILMKIASGNSQSFYWNVYKNKSGYFYITDSAKYGSISIWQMYKNGKGLWSGHAGIVISKDNKLNYNTIEGNTNNNGSSEGYIIAYKKRNYTYQKMDGLRIKGFINIDTTKFK